MRRARPRGTGRDPGRHHIVLVLDGHMTVSERIDVRAGQPFLGDPDAGRSPELEIVTTPPGAHLALDGVPVGSSPQRLSGGAGTA